MKKILHSVVAFALLCGTAGAIGIEWGVDNLIIGDPAALANSTTYGTDVGQYVLQLVWVGADSEYLVDGVLQTGYSVVDSGTLMTVPVETPGVVTGSAEATMAGTYVMMLYNNYGGYYGLTDGTTGITSFSVTQPEIDEGVGIYDYSVTGTSVYRGALVPEPGTAALALAGVALLFRRRKA